MNKMVMMLIVLFVLFPIIASATNQTIGNWHFNEGSGILANDSSGFNNNGTLFNTTWANNFNNGSVNNSALSFDGMDSYMVVNFSSSIDTFVQNDFTLNAWVKYNNTGSDQIIWKQFTSGSNDIQFAILSTNKVQMYVFQSGYKALYTTATTLPINTWESITFQRSGNNGLIYFNGISQPLNTSTAFGASISAVNVNGEIGGSKNDSFRFFLNGTLDEYTIYNFALNQTELNTVFQTFHPVPAFPVANSIIPAAFPPLQTTVNFTWYDTVYPSDEIQVAQDQNFNVMVHDGFHTTGFANIQLNAGQTYFWRLKQFNSTTNTFGNTSETQTFTIAPASSVTGSGSSIQGIVYEIINGAQTPVSGTQVYLTNSTTSFEFTTSSNGYFLFQNLAANSTYSIHGENAPVYNPTAVFPVTTGNGTTVTQNLLITRFFSPFVPNYVYEKFIVRNLFDTKFPGVTVNVFVDGDVTPTFTKTTDTMGQATFQLIKDQLYRVTFSGGGLSDTITVNVYGKEEEYPINVLGGVPSTNISSNNVQAILDHSAFNATFENLTLAYNDTSLTTTSLTFFVINSTNGNNTVLFNTTLASTNVANLNFTVPNTCTCSYIYGYFTAGGFPTNEARTINFGGTVKTTLSSDVQNWIAIILLVILASMFSARNVKIGAILLPIVAFVLVGFGWLIVNPIYPAIVLILGVLYYMRRSEVKTQI